MVRSSASVLTDIDVSVVRVQLRGSAFRSPQYVFAVHPLNMRVRPGRVVRGDGAAIASTFISSALRPIMGIELPAVHEVARTYSQCRKLYRELLKLTNATKRDACQCARRSADSAEQRLQRESCSCSALFPLLDVFMLPRKRLLRRRSHSVLQERRFAFNLLLKSVVQRLQLLYIERRSRHLQHQQHQRQRQQQRQQQQRRGNLPAWELMTPELAHAQRQARTHVHTDVISSSSDRHHTSAAAAGSGAGNHTLPSNCKVVVALLRFLALDDDRAVRKLRETSEWLYEPLTLDGWRSDHKNLYFLSEGGDPKPAPRSDHGSNDDDGGDNSDACALNGGGLDNSVGAAAASSSNGASKHSDVAWGVWSGASSSSSGDDLDEQFALWIRSHHNSADS